MSLDTKARIKLAQTFHFFAQSYKTFGSKIIEELNKLVSLINTKDMKVGCDIFKNWPKRRVVLIDKFSEKEELVWLWSSVL